MAQQYSRALTLTSDLSTVAFGFRPTYISVSATTAGTAYLCFSTAVATTNSSTDSASYQLTSGAAPLVFSWPNVAGMSSQFTAIASTGTTGVIRVLATRV